MSAVLGIDVGTTAVKAVVVGPDGNVLGRSQAATEVLRAESGAAEQDMEQVWRGVVRVIRDAVAAGGARVVGIGVTGQGDGAWLVDGDGRPVGPAALWLDARAADRVRAWQRDGRDLAVRRYTGSAVFPGALPVLLDELAHRHPDRIARARYQLNCKDWVRYRLTGVLATDASEASRTYLDVHTGRYSTELLDALGHGRYADLLAPVRPPGEAAGTVRAEVAAEVGVPAGTPVVTGLVDTAAAGAGLRRLRAGDSYAIVGTTAFVGAVRSAAGPPDTGRPVITLATGYGREVVECLAPMAGTPNLDWARRCLAPAGPDRAPVEAEWARVEAAARDAGPGAGGVLYLPYAADGGERAPFVDPDASAGWLGTSVRTTPGQLLRAVYEGIALSLRECMAALDVGDTVRLCGGGATSALLCQVIADVTGRTVDGGEVAEVGALGVAALAAEHAGLDPSGWPLHTRRYSPEPAARRHYDERYAAFVAVRDALRPHWPRLGRAATAAATNEGSR